jgi:drug/metabolite transporter (DMT)-like permease
MTKTFLSIALFLGLFWAVMVWCTLAVWHFAPAACNMAAAIIGVVAFAGGFAYLWFNYNAHTLPRARGE